MTRAHTHADAIKPSQEEIGQLCRASGWHLSDAANEPTTFRQIHEEAQAEARAILRQPIQQRTV